LLLSRAWVPSRKILLCQAPSNARSLSRKLQVPSLEPGPPDSVLAEKQQLHKGICAMLGKYLTRAAGNCKEFWSPAVPVRRMDRELNLKH